MYASTLILFLVCCFPPILAHPKGRPLPPPPTLPHTNKLPINKNKYLPIPYPPSLDYQESGSFNSYSEYLKYLKYSTIKIGDDPNEEDISYWRDRIGVTLSRLGRLGVGVGNMRKRADPVVPEIKKLAARRLFGESGLPFWKDVKQYPTVNSCGLTSALQSISHLLPELLAKNLFVAQNTTTDPTSVLVGVTNWDIIPLVKLGVEVQREWINETNMDTGDVWWPGAFEKAIEALGQPTTFVQSSKAMTMISGLSASYNVTTNAAIGGDINKEQSWSSILIKCLTTPITIQTHPNVTGDLTRSHIYTVLKAEDLGGVKTLTLHNPLGWDNVISYDKAWPQLYVLDYLTAFPTRSDFGLQPLIEEVYIPIPAPAGAASTVSSATSSSIGPSTSSTSSTSTAVPATSSTSLTSISSSVSGSQAVSTGTSSTSIPPSSQSANPESTSSVTPPSSEEIYIPNSKEDEGRSRPGRHGDGGGGGRGRFLDQVENARKKWSDEKDKGGGGGGGGQDLLGKLGSMLQGTMWG